MERRGRPRVVRYFAQRTAQGKSVGTNEPWQRLPELSGCSDTFRYLFAAEGLEQGRQEVGEGQHHQGEAGVLVQCLVTEVTGQMVNAEQTHGAISIKNGGGTWRTGPRFKQY